MSVANTQLPSASATAVDSTITYESGLSWATGIVRASPISSSWVAQSSSSYNSSYPQHHYACWQPDQTGAIVGSIFGGIAIGLLIASWIAMFIAWRRTKARALRAIRDLEQRVCRESFDSETFYETPDSARSEDKLPLLFHFGQDRDERKSADDSPAQA